MPRYLVVDDSPTVRLVISRSLQRAGGGMAEVVEADGAKAALEAFDGDEFEAIFLDLMLTEDEQADGLEVLDAILQKEPNARVVVVTGLAEDHPAVVSSVSKGAFAHVRKPVRTPAVASVLMDLEMEMGRMGRIP